MNFVINAFTSVRLVAISKANDLNLEKAQILSFYFVHNRWQKSIQFSFGQISNINGRRMTLRSEYAFYPMFSLMSDCTNISINV